MLPLLPPGVPAAAAIAQVDNHWLFNPTSESRRHSVAVFLNTGAAFVSLILPLRLLLLPHVLVRAVVCMCCIVYV